MMSKVNIKFNCNNLTEEDELNVPIVYTYSNSNSLYVLIKDERAERPYRVICLDNGYIQAGSGYSSIKEFMDSRKGAIFVDIDILVKSL